MCPTKKINKFFLVLFIASLFIILSAPAFAANDPVARLTAFSGTVMIKSQGEWGVEATVGLPLYSDDKVVTRAGLATVTFDDGAVLELKSNSNLLIYEQEKEEGFFRKTKVIQRRLRLLIGKLKFKTGTSDKNNILETPTMVCGLRGTSGVLSIAEDGTPYIRFDEGGPSFTIGDFISGEAADIPQALADIHPAQRAAIVAAAAAFVAKDAAAQAAEAAGTPQAQQLQAQAAYNAALAAQKAMEEYRYQASVIAQNSSESDLVEQANADMAKADVAIAETISAQQDAIDAGAEAAEPETYEMPVPEGIEQVPPEELEFEFEVPTEEEPPIDETEPASPV